jgi:branched-subunit amino acid transport protein
MSDSWLVVLLVSASTIVLKASGPVVLGSRTLPPRLVNVVMLLAPVLLTAFVVVQTIGGNEEIVIDARLPAVVAGGVAIVLRVPLIGAMVIAGVVAGTLHALG